VGQMLLKYDKGEFHHKFCVFLKLTAVGRKTALGILYTALVGIPILLFFAIFVRFVTSKHVSNWCLFKSFDMGIPSDPFLL
jgi:hypothetical protein